MQHDIKFATCGLCNLLRTGASAKCPDAGQQQALWMTLINVHCASLKNLNMHFLCLHFCELLENVVLRSKGVKSCRDVVHLTFRSQSPVAAG